MDRIRDFGIEIGDLHPGPLNAITDVGGVKVGHITLALGDGPLRVGYGPVRTGVTVVLPHGGNLFCNKVCAAVHTINGFGKVVGFEQVRELGVIESPIALTNTLNVGLVMDALVSNAIQENPNIGIRTGSVNVVVGETNDGYLNDIQGRHVKAEHVWSAIDTAAGGPVPEGAVGAGTGTCCFGWKGGIGTASRVLPPELGRFTLGVLVQSNFGRPDDLTVCGLAVGKRLSSPYSDRNNVTDSGSIMVVMATDAPLTSRQLERLCKRVPAGLARVGGHLSHGSGDFVVAFTTSCQIPHASNSTVLERVALDDEAGVINGLFWAVVESVEEAILNSLVCAETMTGRDGHVAYALPMEQVVELLNASGSGGF
jgi:D-aminopeptidase